jgi:galactose mutarotase-like enzyme
MDDLLYKGYKTLFLENDIIRVGVLLDKGADIFQFLHKPTDTDFLWRSPQGLVRKDQFEPTRASASGSFLDFYHGGWQEILPGGGPCDYRGAELGLHGEVTHLGWDCDILADSPEEIAVRLSVQCVRTPLRLERILRLVKGEATLFIDEVLTNLSPEPVEFMWGHHPAFGAPFLKEGCRVFVPARRGEVHNPRFAESSIFEPGQVFSWPLIQKDGQTFDLSCIPSDKAGFADLIYLSELQEGWYAVIDPERSLGIGLSWPKEIFPYLWFWMVYGRAPGYPWWDQVYCIALEPWTSIPNSLNHAIERKTQSSLRGGGSTSVHFTATVITGRNSVTHIDRDGKVSGSFSTQLTTTKEKER